MLSLTFEHKFHSIETTIQFDDALPNNVFFASTFLANGINIKGHYIDNSINNSLAALTLSDSLLNLRLSHNPLFLEALKNSLLKVIKDYVDSFDKGAAVEFIITSPKIVLLFAAMKNINAIVLLLIIAALILLGSLIYFSHRNLFRIFLQSIAAEYNVRVNPIHMIYGTHSQQAISD
jgi:hypothetical protein